MSKSIANVGGSLTGGATVVLVPAGISGSKSSYQVTGSTRAVPKLVAFVSVPSQTTKTGTSNARSEFKVTIGEDISEEGCCATVIPLFILDLGARIPNGISATTIEEGLNLAAAMLLDSGVRSMFTTGLLVNG